MGVGRGGARESCENKKEVGRPLERVSVNQESTIPDQSAPSVSWRRPSPQLAVAVKSRRDFKNSARTLFDYHSLRPGILIWQLLQQNKTDATELRQCEPS